MNIVEHSELQRQVEELLYRDTLGRVWAYAWFLHFWHQKRMVHGACVWITVQLIKSPSSIYSQSLS